MDPAIVLFGLGISLMLYMPHWVNRRRGLQRQQEADQARALGQTLPAD